MPQPTPWDVEQGSNQGALYIASVPPKFTNLYKIDGGQTPSAPYQEPKEPTFGDSSGPFFSMYSKAAEQEDEKMVEGWQKDAKGILIFVSASVRICIVSCTNQNTRRVFSLPQSPHSLL
jgi:hypothetical protein